MTDLYADIDNGKCLKFENLVSTCTEYKRALTKRCIQQTYRKNWEVHTDQSVGKLRNQAAVAGIDWNQIAEFLDIRRDEDDWNDSQKYCLRQIRNITDALGIEKLSSSPLETTGQRHLLDKASKLGKSISDIGEELGV